MEISPAEIVAALDRCLLYQPKLNKITGSVCGSILLKQINYWWFHNNQKPFYKFVAACNSPDYRDGDSWQEELGFTRHEFETARNAIAVRVPKGESWETTLQTNMVVYWVDMARKTWYAINVEKFSLLLAQCLVSNPTKSIEETSNTYCGKPAIRNAGNQQYVTPETSNSLKESESTPGTTSDINSLAQQTEFAGSGKNSNDISLQKKIVTSSQSAQPVLPRESAVPVQTSLPGVPLEAEVPTKKQRRAQPAIPREAKSKREPDPAAKHPAMQIYQEVTNLSVRKGVRALVIDALDLKCPESPTDEDQAKLALWRSCVRTHISRGWSPVNIDLMLQAYSAGGTEKLKPKVFVDPQEEKRRAAEERMRKHEEAQTAYEMKKYLETRHNRAEQPKIVPPRKGFSNGLASSLGDLKRVVEDDVEY